MNERIVNFTIIIFHLEDNIKEIFIDYIEDESEFISIDFRKVRKNFWLCKLILKANNLKKKYLKLINGFRKNFKLSNLSLVNDDNVKIRTNRKILVNKLHKVLDDNYRFSLLEI